MSRTKAQKYKSHLKKIADDSILSLEPIVKKQSNQIFDLVKDITSDIITTIFDKKRNKTK